MAAPGDFLGHVLPTVPGCPDLAAKLDILRACIQFCREARVWRAWLDPVDVVAGQMEYALPVPVGATVARVEEAGLGDARLGPMTREDALERYGEGWDTALRGEPRNYLVPGPGTLALVPIPARDGAALLKVFATLEPTPTAATVPDWLLADYPETIAHGALARLLAVPGKPWSHPQLALWHGRRFQADIGSYAAVVARGRTCRPLGTRSVFR
ncbi:hypothetical protein [Methylomagnum ishizawai]|uniref:phage adaptor protein n=1 Tax=Methylomagnum ishizawai TaxID=1760988 RepID=UPI001C342D59|nr:hypothetical protein [Methylomagnum ishizawai]BBL74174.1 hypothetical protein MishRS11D_12720 [Methylomagnum ishizawai]